MRVIVAITLVLSLALVAFAASVAAQQPEPALAYRVIVHPDNPVTSVDRQFLADAFLKKLTRWPDKRMMHPVDLLPGSDARSRFTRDVLRRSVAAIKAYWQQRIFSGRGVPPPELGDEARVVAYVLEHNGAVGYVSAAAELKGAKAISVRW
jgi:ABC-type phosphate transport system substrate-binding protein